jgi:sugar lactone lactonase YvrE
MRRVIEFFAAGMMVAGTVAAQVPAITTVAGSGVWGYCGDGGPATEACLDGPWGVAVDTAGGIYFADDANSVIRKVDRTGTISTVAGNGTYGEFCGDGGPATRACLNQAWDVTVDASGNLFIADSINNRIRRVDSTGTIRTVAGSATEGFCGDGGPATSACLAWPHSVAVDASGNLFIADHDNARIRRVDTSGTITTVAGNGTWAYCGDGGPATSACLRYPTGVAVDAAGNVFIADSGNHRIRRVNPAGTITTVAGNGEYWFCGDGGPATSACLSAPGDVAVDAVGNLYIADEHQNRIRRVDTAGTIRTIAGSGPAGFCGDGGAATEACLDGPRGVAVDAAGRVFIGDYHNRRVRKVGLPEELEALRLSSTTLTGCLKTSGEVSLAEPAPAGGLIVALHSDNPNIVVPGSVAFKGGVLARSFPIVTRAVASLEPATIEASVPGQGLSATLMLKPIVLKDLTLTPNPVVGGNPSGGTMTLRCPAGPGDIEVTLASSNPSVATPTVSHITIPFGTQVMTFDLTTTPVPRVYSPAISATANGVKRSRPLTVNPVP